MKRNEEEEVEESRAKMKERTRWSTGSEDRRKERTK